MKINQITISACAFILMLFAGCSQSEKYVSLKDTEKIIIKTRNGSPQIIGVHDPNSDFAKSITKAINSASWEFVKFSSVYQVQFQSSETNINFYINKKFFMLDGKPYKSSIDLQQLIKEKGINK
ncbi:hypothetical protein P4E94_19765 [Pontiellaceae bacterium B12219]|nr:hypothetical protein [Pontiellaceae bacterium B12219]